MISLRGVSKSYRSLTGRTVLAVDDVSFDVAPGEVLGIAGPNGAGKTTIIAMLLGFLRPTAGQITISGLRPRAYVEQNGIAYLPELMALMKTWKVDHALRRLATLSGVDGDRVDAEVARVISLMEVGEHAHKRVKALSKGNFQRVGLAQALLREFNVVIFDEPTHGLDPVWTQRFRSVVSDLRRPNRAIIIASHNLDELDRVADRVAIIDRGRLQRIVTMGTQGAAARVYLLRLTGDPAAVLAAFPGATVQPSGEVALPPLGVVDLNAGLQVALAAGAQITGLSPRESALEAEFHAAVSGGQPAGQPAGAA
ncbi:MAG: ABC transporter ATP-binding protein [Gemmatimonadetes bacterium]|nr:ABC transporter ATP-binding protein [Gemmatimonadota bacterium]